MKNNKTVWKVEECLFPMEKNPDWIECCEFATEEEAQDFAWRHYDSATNYSGRPNPCKCQDCNEGWKVSATWWKSYEVRVTKTTTTQEEK